MARVNRLGYILSDVDYKITTEAESLSPSADSELEVKSVVASTSLSTAGSLTAATLKLTSQDIDVRSNPELISVSVSNDGESSPTIVFPASIKHQGDITYDAGTWTISNSGVYLLSAHVQWTVNDTGHRQLTWRIQYPDTSVYTFATRTTGIPLGAADHSQTATACFYIPAGSTVRLKTQIACEIALEVYGRNASVVCLMRTD